MRLGLPVVALLLAGCPRPRAAGPEDTLAAYLNAVGANRLDEAYGLMSTEYRKSHDRAAFERALGDRRGVGKLRGAEVALFAEVALPDGEKLPLVLEGGAWRIARDPLDFYPQRTPEEALRSFLRAVEARRYDIVWKFVPSQYHGTVSVDAIRARWEGERRAELVGQLDAIRKSLQRGEPFELGPPEGEARLQVGEHKQAKLAREGNLWKVFALE